MQANALQFGNSVLVKHFLNNIPEICVKITISGNLRGKTSRNFATYTLGATHLIISRLFQ